MTRSRIRLVLLDAFDTLITPRLPIHRQYADEANKLGLAVSEDAVRAGFKTSFPSLNKKHPLYGLHSVPPLTAEQWWTFLIEETMIGAGVDRESLAKSLPTLSSRLLERFASSEGYRAFDDVLPALEAFKKLNVRTAVLSNADTRILRVLDSLSITSLLSAPPTLNHSCGFSKPDPEIFQFATKQAGVDVGDALMIGDELDADFQGSTSAGLHGLLIRREGEFSDGAKRKTSEDLKDVKVVTSLEQAVEYVRDWNTRCPHGEATSTI